MTARGHVTTGQSSIEAPQSLKVETMAMAAWLVWYWTTESWPHHLSDRRSAVVRSFIETTHTVASVPSELSWKVNIASGGDTGGNIAGGDYKIIVNIIVIHIVLSNSSFLPCRGFVRGDLMAAVVFMSWCNCCSFGTGQSEYQSRRNPCLSTNSVTEEDWSEMWVFSQNGEESLLQKAINLIHSSIHTELSRSGHHVSHQYPFHTIADCTHSHTQVAFISTKYTMEKY